MLNKKTIDEIKISSQNIIEGTEAIVFICDNMVLKQFKHNEKGLFNKKVLGNNLLIKNIMLLNNIKKTTNQLCESGVATPKIIDYFVSQEHENIESYILMERAIGKPVFARNYAFLNNYSFDNIKNLDEKSFLKHYYENMIFTLSKAPQLHFDNFAKDCFIIENSSRATLDIWGENIIYDKQKGFSNIDLRIDDVDKNKMTKQQLNNRVCKACLDYVGFLNEEIDKDTNHENYLKNKSSLNQILIKSISALNKINITKLDIENYCNYNRISNLNNHVINTKISKLKQ